MAQRYANLLDEEFNRASDLDGYIIDKAAADMIDCGHDKVHAVDRY